MLNLNIEGFENLLHNKSSQNNTNEVNSWEEGDIISVDLYNGILVKVNTNENKFALRSPSGLIQIFDYKSGYKNLSKESRIAELTIKTW